MKKKEYSEQRRKVVVVGAGSVGATYCYALAQSGLADEIVLIDRNENLARGQVLDLGEHGDSEFAAWSMTNVAGINIDEYCPVCGRCSDWKKQRSHIEQQVRESAYHIINYKGSTQFAVGLALVKITGAILRSQNSVLIVSTLVDGEFRIKDVCLSLPCVVSDSGINKILESPLPSEELDSLSRSADVLRKAIDYSHFF